MLQTKILGLVVILIGVLILVTTSQGIGIAVENIWDVIAMLQIVLGAYIAAKG